MSTAPLRSFSEIVQERVARDSEYAAALLAEAVQCFVGGEISVARAVVRDVIKGSIGYTELAKRTGTPETSLVRMFGPSGNPTFANVSNVISQLLAACGAELQVTSVSTSRRSTERRSASPAPRPKPARRSDPRRRQSI